MEHGPAALRADGGREKILVRSVLRGMISRDCDFPGREWEGTDRIEGDLTDLETWLSYTVDFVKRSGSLPQTGQLTGQTGEPVVLL